MLDTLKLAKQLEAANLPAEQAEAIATAIAEVASGELVTKADLQNQLQGLESRLHIDMIDRFETVNERINSVRDRLTWSVIGVGGLTWLLQLFGTTLKHFLGLP